MINLSLKIVAVGLSSILLLSACGSGAGDDTVASIPAVEVTDPAFPEISNRASAETRSVTFVLLDDGSVNGGQAGTLSYADGVISGGFLDGLDIDGAEFTNPANGEFTRILTTSSNGNLFGVVGVGTDLGDRPDTGRIDYNEGWVGVTATSESNVFTLEGTATLSATFDGNAGVTATFTGFTGTNQADQPVSDVGTLTVTGAQLAEFDSVFGSGTIAGTGVFAGIDPTLSSSEFFGAFYGPDADEVGGIIDVDDGPVTVSGAFQAD